MNKAFKKKPPPQTHKTYCSLRKEIAELKKIDMSAFDGDDIGMGILVGAQMTMEWALGKNSQRPTSVIQRRIDAHID